MTPQEIERAVRLESIFMPVAHAQRGFRLRPEVAISEQFIRFAHYTSADAGLSIIRSRRVWMRNAGAMADYREIEHGITMLRAVFSAKGIQEFSSVLDSCCPGAATEGFQLFDQWLQHIARETYIFSVSEHEDPENAHGRLSMWRAFGNRDAPRVAICMKIPAYAGAGDTLGLLFSPVAYLNEQQVRQTFGSILRNIHGEAAFLQTVDKQHLTSLVFYMLIAAATCLKHEGFREELEWRAIYIPMLRSSPLMECSTESISGVPQRVYKIPLDKTVSPDVAVLDFAAIFDRLIIGPTAYPWVMYQAFADELKRAGIADAEKRIAVSGIPIRS